MKKHALVFASSVFAAVVWADAPQVSNVSSTQDPTTRKVTVAYTLSAPAIVTLSVETNVADEVWAPIGDENLWYVSGAANKKVAAGEHTLTWLPHKAWPNHVITDSKIRIGVKAWALDCPPEIMAVDLKAANTVNYYSSAAALPGGVQDKRYKTDVLVLRHIPAANVTWTMGSPTTELGRNNGNEYAHQVTLEADYWIGVYEITQRQYEHLTGLKPAYFNHPDYYATRPVDCCSYDTVVGSDGFIVRLRNLSGLSGFTLPTEAQWEFACRAGEGAALYSGQNLASKTEDANLGLLARYRYNSGETSSLAPQNSGPELGSAPVGSYAPNAWGIYDLFGNVMEWCLDWYQDDISEVDPATGPTSGSNRAVRGGWHRSEGAQCRSAFRGSYPSSAGWGENGFRVACPIAAE
ncbi:MAG: formylglycine-generating enzyme family protein [Kiritimatiellia bacterium]